MIQKHNFIVWLLKSEQNIFLYLIITEAFQNILANARYEIRRRENGKNRTTSAAGQGQQEKKIS